MRLLPFEYAVRNLGRSRTRLALSVFGSALVVLLVLCAGAFVRGMDRSLRSTGEADNIILLGAGSEESIERSEVNASVAGLVGASIDGVRRRAGGGAEVEYVSPEVHVQLPVRVNAGEVDRGGGKGGPLVLVRGVTPGALLVHSTVQVVEGRFPSSDRDEVMLGAMVPRVLGAPEASLAIGRSVLIDGQPWTIVGRFISPGTVLESEVWTARASLMQASKRDTDSCIIVTIDPERADFADVAAFAKMRPDLELSALRETEYYGRLSDFFAPIRAVVWLTAGLITFGGLMGGLNTMYAAFASRVRELGTLQSIGFRRASIVVSMMQESTLATATGTLLACAAAAVFVDGLAVRFSLGSFGLVVDAPVLLVGLAAGLGLGVLGALPPAWKCLRLSIPVALKSV